MGAVDIFGRTLNSFIHGLIRTNDESLRIDERNSMSANLNAGGFKVINCANPTNYYDVTNKGYVDNKHAEQLRLTGGTMTGDLMFSSPAGHDVAIYLGCIGLDDNKQFTILMGNLNNSISYTNPGTINIQASNGTLFRLGKSDIMRIGTDVNDNRIKTSQEILLGADIDANEFTIKNLDTPINPSDAVPKHYVDEKFNLLLDAIKRIGG